MICLLLSFKLHLLKLITPPYYETQRLVNIPNRSEFDFLNNRIIHQAVGYRLYICPKQKWQWVAICSIALKKFISSLYLLRYALVPPGDRELIHILLLVNYGPPYHYSASHLPFSALKDTLIRILQIWFGHLLHNDCFYILTSMFAASRHRTG